MTASPQSFRFPSFPDFQTRNEFRSKWQATAVIPANAGIHLALAVVAEGKGRMDPGFRRDDGKSSVILNPVLPSLTSQARHELR
jgi:hypothetical protein